MVYLIGDIQGCDQAFERLLAEIDFSPSRARLVVLGDLVNRGPGSLVVIRRLRAFGAAATCLLGNHDLHLLAVACGARKMHRNDTFGDVLADPDREAHLEWLRERPLAHEEAGWLCVHAGVAPQWDRADVLANASDLQRLLRGPESAAFLRAMYGNEAQRWSSALAGLDRARFVVNALTRIRFCRDDGTLDLETKEGAHAAPPGFMPWYAVPGRRTLGQPIAFGHWSTHGRIDTPQLLALDTGCVWGGELSAVRVDGGRVEWTQVRCPQAQRPGS